MNPGHAMLVAVACFAAWISILYAGADRPPPRGFAWLVVVALPCAAGVYLRAPVYASWSIAHRPGRLLRVILEGLAAGMVVGLIVLVSPFGGEPGSGASVPGHPVFQGRRRLRKTRA
ncbi:MAG: hypothetical protein GC183_14665 [Thiobacillus sp.]|nr:hypothetical protein [Thiobacillus sp.]